MNLLTSFRITDSFEQHLGGGRGDDLDSIMSRSEDCQQFIGQAREASHQSCFKGFILKGDGFRVHEYWRLFYFKTI